MFTASFRNVEHAYNVLTRMILKNGIKEDSRHGTVLSFPHPVLIKVLNPGERVLMDPARNANPFFHLFESIWMMAGKNDVSFVSQFNQQMNTYSDDGEVFNGAYGHRWREYFGYDQISRAIDMLRTNPGDRRVVISMWDAHSDLGSTSLDIPCNQQIFPRIYGGKLNFLTTNRSNDLIWGLCGANAVHLTVLMEFMAHALGLPLGEWHHISNNLHVYEHHFALLKGVVANPHLSWTPHPGTQPLLLPGEAVESFTEDCHNFCEGQDDDFATAFFNDTVAPMVQGWHKWRRDGSLEGAIYDASCVEANDWRKASVSWLRRKEK